MVWEDSEAGDVGHVSENPMGKGTVSMGRSSREWKMEVTRMVFGVRHR